MAVEQMIQLRATPHRLSDSKTGPVICPRHFSIGMAGREERRSMAGKEKLRWRNTVVILGDEKRKGAYNGRPKIFL